MKSVRLGILLCLLVFPVQAFSAEPRRTMTKLDPKDDPALLGIRRDAKRAVFGLGTERANGSDLAMHIGARLTVTTSGPQVRCLQDLTDKLKYYSGSDQSITTYIVNTDYPTILYDAGFIWLTTGILRLCQSESDVAALLAHPIGHIVKRHWAAKYSWLLIWDEAATPAILLRPLDFGVDQMGIYYLLERYADAMPEREEEEADSLAAQVLYVSGYDPTAVASVNARIHTYLLQHPEWQMEQRPVLMSCLLDQARQDIVTKKVSHYEPRGTYLVSTSAFEDFADALAKQKETKESNLKFKTSFKLFTPEEEKQQKAEAVKYKKLAKEQVKGRLHQQLSARLPFGLGQMADLVVGIFKRRKGDYGRDVNYGYYLFKGLQSSNAVLPDPETEEFVNRCANNLARAAGVDLNTQTAVVNDKIALAGAFPGGFLFVTTGWILTSDNESELAGVLAHEIDHVRERHTHKEYTRDALSIFMHIPLIYVLGQWAPFKLLFAGVLTYKYGRLPLLAAWERRDELQADKEAVVILEKAGYDPRGYRDALIKMRNREQASPYRLSLLRRLRKVHPSTERRIAAVSAQIERLVPTEKLFVTSTDFDSMKAHLEHILKYGPDTIHNIEESTPVPPVLRRKTNKP